MNNFRSTTTSLTVSRNINTTRATRPSRARLTSWITRSIAMVCLCLGAAAHAADSLRVGVLKFGTVNWELDVIKHHGLDAKHGYDLDVLKLGGGGASKVALQGEEVRVIVSDWIWVARQRAEDRNYTFAPYSLAVGGVMTHPDAGINTIADLKGKRLGIAGGPVDKSWLLLRAYTRKTMDLDLADELEPNFGAPPLINKLISKGDLDAVLNFWHFGAKLKAAGMKELIAVSDILPELGIDGGIPLLGWVFDEQWANDNQDLVKAFLASSYEAKKLMLDSDAEWDRLRPKMKADDDNTFIALRDTWRAGVPMAFGDAEKERASKTFAIMAEVGGPKLTGTATELLPGTFWDKIDLGPLANQ